MTVLEAQFEMSLMRSERDLASGLSMDQVGVGPPNYGKVDTQDVLPDGRASIGFLGGRFKSLGLQMFKLVIPILLLCATINLTVGVVGVIDKSLLESFLSKEVPGFYVVQCLLVGSITSIISVCLYLVRKKFRKLSENREKNGCIEDEFREGGNPHSREDSRNHWLNK